MRNFRGKRIDSGECVEGDYSLYQKYYGGRIFARISHIDPNNKIQLISYEVHPDSVGQSTGLKDKNSVEIFEKDILATSNDGLDGCDCWTREIIGDVYWNDKFACFNHRIALGNEESVYSLKYIEIIGNTTDDKHLLEK